MNNLNFKFVDTTCLYIYVSFFGVAHIFHRICSLKSLFWKYSKL